MSNISIPLGQGEPSEAALNFIYQHAQPQVKPFDIVKGGGVKPVDTDDFNAIAGLLEEGKIDFTEIKHHPKTNPKMVGLSLIEERLGDTLPGLYEHWRAENPKRTKAEIFERMDRVASKLVKLYLAAGLDIRDVPDNCRLDKNIILASTRQTLPETHACLSKFLEDGIRPTTEELAAEGITFDPEKRRSAVTAYHQKCLDTKYADIADEAEKARRENLPSVAMDDALYAQDIAHSLDMNVEKDANGRARLDGKPINHTPPWSVDKAKIVYMGNVVKEPSHIIVQ